MALAGVPSGQTQSPDAAVNLRLLKSGESAKRTKAAEALIDNWESSLPLLVDTIGQFAAMLVGGKFSAERALELLPVTDVVRTIILNKNAAISKFRGLDNDKKSIRVLIWAARGDQKELRLNSTYILASVVENTGLCIVLDHLRDPTLNQFGRVNLLQVVAAVAGYAYMENVTAIKETLRDLKTRLSGDVTRSTELMTAILDIPSQNANKNLPAALGYCATYRYTSKPF